MDKKTKIVIIITFCVLVGGIVFDANTKMKAMKNKKDNAVETVSDESQQQREAFSNQESTDKASFETMATKANRESTSQPRGPEEEDEMDMPPNMPEEMSKKPPKLPTEVGDSSYFVFEGTGISQKVTEIAPFLTVTDKLLNKYYFIPSGPQMSKDSLGLLIKLSPTKELIWQKELKSMSYAKPNISAVRATSNSIQLEIPKTQSTLPANIVFNQNGTLISNPTGIKFSTVANKPPSDFRIEYITSFQHKNQDFAIIASTDMKPKGSVSVAQQEFCIYKSRPGVLTKQYLLFEKAYFLGGRNGPTPALTVQNGPTELLFVALAPETGGAAQYTNAVRLPSIALTGSPSVIRGTAPLSITQGITIKDSTYAFKIDYKN